MKFFISILFLLLTSSLFAVTIKGVVKSEKGEPIPFVSIQVKQTSINTAANDSGQYLIHLKPGKYLISYDMLGYIHEEKEVKISASESMVLVDVVLKENQICLNELVVCYKKNNEGRDLMRKARAKRKFYNEQIQTINYIANQKISLEKEVKKTDFTKKQIKKHRSDSLLGKDSSVMDTINPFSCNDSIPTDTIEQDSMANISVDSSHISKDSLARDTIAKRHLIYLTESNNRIYYEKPSKYKVIVNAQHEYFGRDTYFYGRDQLFTYHIGADRAIPIQYVYSNPYVKYEDITNCDFNFYENNIYYPDISQTPLLSPLAATAELSYRFILYDTCFENTKKIYKIAVNPIFKSDALFSGFIYIEDSTWAIRSVDLSVNKQALVLCKEFNVKQVYTQVGKDTYFPLQTELAYNLRDGKRYYYGNIKIVNSNFTVNQLTPNKIFNDEVKIYKPDSFDKDSIFWDTCRVIKLEKADSAFIHESDTLKAYYQSEVFQRKTDSIINKFKIEKIFLGYYHINRQTGFIYNVGGLISQLNPVGIGGVRYQLPLYFRKTFKNEMMLDVNTNPDYGFVNKDLKGSMSFRLLYYPKKFVGTAVRFGDNYNVINNNASISQVFSRSNFIRSKFYGITQQVEIVNGLFAEVTFDYSERRSISNMHLEKWTTDVFGRKLNTPIDFNPYNKSEASFRLGYRHKQKFMIKRRTKIILGSKYPELSIKYRKGIKDLFKSDEDFDYLELKLEDNRKLARYGTINWQVLTGSFVNKSSLRVVEYKYFRGSDPFFFSNPLVSYQLLGPTLSTTNAFVQAGFIHHFDGSIFNKLPLLNKLKMDASFGAGSFSIPKEKVYHFEMFAGIDKTIRIRTQLFKIGIYAVTSDNSLNKARLSFKIGINTYDLYSKKWLY